MKTDCMSLLSTARGGLARATAASHPLARLWSQIGNCTDGSIISLVEEDLLTWMPSHQTIASIDKAVLSNGKKLSVVDWSANRLVDALAKQAAAQRRAPVAITRLMASARVAVKHSARLLGRVTHAANQCKHEVVMPDGSKAQRTRRDAQSHTGQQRRPGGRREQHRVLAPPVQLLQETPAVVGSHHERCERKRTASQAALLANSRQKVARAERARSKAADDAHSLRIVGEIGTRLAVPKGRLPAEVRFQNVLQRIRQRAAAGQVSGT